MYDARNSSGGNSSNLIFGLATLAVVGGAFLAVWKGPDLIGAGRSASPAPQASAASVSGAGIAALATTPDEKRYLAAMSRLSPNVYRQVERDLPGAGNNTIDRLDVMQRAAIPVLRDHADALARVSVQDIDNLVDGGIGELQKLQRSGSKWCKGSHYAQFEGLSPRQVERKMRREGLTEEAMAPVAMRMNADFLEMIERARKNPTRHGKLTSQDEQALQGMLMSLMADPSVMKAMMAGGNEAEAMERLNVCSIGATALKSFRRLPSGTKGRAWAATFENGDFNRALRNAERNF